MRIDLAPEGDLRAALGAAKQLSKRRLAGALAEHVPRRLADAWLGDQPTLVERPMAEVRDRDLDHLTERLRRWELTPSGTEGYRKAEVTLGGVDTRELHSRTMESRRTPGMFFIGEVVDVTGWLGGYNFQWAWSSAAACARAMASAARGEPAGSG